MTRIYYRARSEPMANVEPTRNELVPVTTISATLCADVSATAEGRKSFLIRNMSTDATDILTIVMGNQPAVANKGIPLRQFESYGESNDSGFQCWQGQIQIISAAAVGTVQASVFER